MAEKFSEHQGAGVWVGTIGACEGGFSLAGATSVHHLELCDSPMAMYQAERRPCLPGQRGLVIVYYSVRGTYDERALTLLIPKIEAIATQSNHGEVGETAAVLKAEKLSTDEILAELTEDVMFIEEFSDEYGMDLDNMEDSF
jgi:hypothetical protein